MNRFTKTIGVIGILLPTLIACKSLTISMTGTNPPKFSFSASQFAECCRNLDIFSVIEESCPKSKTNVNDKTLWMIHPGPGTDSSAEALPEITYGILPPGFVQTIPLQGAPPQLQEGCTYEATGPTVKVPFAHVRFRIRNGYVFEIRN